jgi:EAL domain-containing protein (putative c-di-GMP-specific phosphodiesterase class I)
VDTLLKKLLIASEKALNTYEREFAICFYDDDMEAQITRAEDIKRELAKAASDEDDGGLFLLYQPILDLKQNRICAFEALARLKSDKLGIVPPLEFIPIAERTKLIIPLGYKIIKKSLAFLNRLKASGYGSVGVSINVSVIQLLNNDFLENLFKIIADMGANPENICIEITESVFASNYQEINNIIGHLQETGLHIAIDDFGTGYSSLARERELQVNCLKIDKHFIDKLLITKPEKAITGDIISMAHKLGHCAIAEGVEHKKQLKDLQSFCCDKIQGYLIGRPLDEGAAIALLEKTIPNAPV